MEKNKKEFPLTIAVYGKQEDVLGLTEFLSKRLKFKKGMVEFDRDIYGEFEAYAEVLGAYVDDDGNYKVLEDLSYSESEDLAEFLSNGSDFVCGDFICDPETLKTLK